MEKLAQLIVTGRIDPSRLLTHRFEGFDKIEEALFLMRDKPRDLIKPVISISW
jgi:threonine dehydrogenase-like Zn-dependent dehydrogenase